MTKYQCPNCDWVGTKIEMEADYLIVEDEDGLEQEMWSNWICPECGTWHQLEDYTVVK